MLSLNSLFNLEDSSNIYSADIHKGSEICLPVTSKSCVHFFSLENYNLIKTVILDNLKPDIAIYLDSENVLIGCQDSSPPIIISKKNDIDIIQLPIYDFFPTSFQKSPNGTIFLGNLKGNPFLYQDNIVKEIDLDTSSTYDCLWINNEYLLVSCFRDSTIKLVQLKGESSRIIQILEVFYPYRFSPVFNNKVLLTSRGWTNRPGRVYLLSIDFSANGDELVPSVQILNEIIIPQSLFRLQRRLPSCLLNLNGFEKYNGYINDVCWWNDENFVVTTRTGNALLMINLEGKIKDIFRMSMFRPTRFISTRLPYERIIFLDAFQARVFELRKIIS